MGAVVAGWGSALPPLVVTNADLEARLDTSDRWITERTGIRARHVGGTTGGLAIDAGRAALERAGATPDQIDLLVLATSTPDAVMPPTAVDVAASLGLTCGVLDLNAACSGYVYGLVVAHGMLELGARRVLLIGSDTMSRITDQDDRGTAVLFADGAGAVVLEQVAGAGELLAWELGTDPSGSHLLACAHGSTIQMDGREVFRRAVRIVVECTNRLLAEAGMVGAEVDLFIPHQANLRIMTAAAERLGIPEDRLAISLDHTGNTSAGSIPTTLVEAIAADRLRTGDRVLYVGFGAGMSWAGALTRWGG